MCTPPDLSALRREIDEIDQRILELLASRMRLVLSVGDLKRQHDLAVYDPERERLVLERLAQAAPSPLTAESVRRVFERLIDESRHVEQQHVTDASR